MAKYLLFAMLLGLSVLGGPVCRAQEVQEAPPPQQSSGITFESIMKRFSVGTNALEWLLTVPNVQIEYDLGNYNPAKGQYNNQSILIGARYNWNTWHQQPAYYVFNVLDVRGEYRFHFPKDMPIKLFNKWDWNITTNHPWLAYYVGGYGNWSQFSVKPGTTGSQGWQAGVGAVIGFERSLYEYKKNGSAIDLDLGIAAGISFSSADQYRLAASQDTYTVTGHRYMLLPMVTELRATFKWRPISVSEKYVKENPQLKLYRDALSDIKNNFIHSTNKASFDQMLLDSLIAVKHVNMSGLDSTGRAEAKYKVYLNYLADSSSVYRNHFIKYLKENEHMLKENYVYVDSTGRKPKIKIREDHEIQKKYLKKLIRAIRSETNKTLSSFDAELRKDKAVLLKQQTEAAQIKAREEYERALEEAEKEKEAKKNKEERGADMHAD